jgi:hypothetical protein
MISADIHSHVMALGPRFALPLEALAAIRAQHGDARMLEQALAHPIDDEAMRLVGLMLVDLALALALRSHSARILKVAVQKTQSPQ